MWRLRMRELDWQDISRLTDLEININGTSGFTPRCQIILPQFNLFVKPDLFKLSAKGP